jgi:V8-like Glu-specific endopeptidase
MNKPSPDELEKQLQDYAKGHPELEQELRAKLAKYTSSESDEAIRALPSARRLPMAQPRPMAEGEMAGPAVALERIIALDSGARPVARIRDNHATTEFLGPDSQSWAVVIQEAEHALNAAIPAVGRIELINSELPWAGTGWMIADGIIVTNRHVAEVFARRDSASDRYVFRTGLREGRISSDIDFLEEEDRADRDEHPVTAILWMSDEADVAFLSISQAAGKPALPKPIELAEQVEEDMTIAAIGYPARDPSIRDQDLVRRIFGDVYEKKRLAPGRVKSVDETLLTHDCSTLGGNSGSVLIDIKTGKAVGLHRGGYLDDSANLAVPAGQLRQFLAEAQQRITRGNEGSQNQAPISPVAPPLLNAEAGGTVSLKLNLPIEITIKVGNLTPWSSPVNQAAPATLTSALEVAKQNFGSSPGVLAIRSGYRFKNGWITDERVIVIEVREKLPHGELEKGGKSPFPREILGVGVDVRTAPLADQLEDLGVDLTALERPSRPAGYTEPPGFNDPNSGMALRRVNDRMKAIFHVSPDSGFPNLKKFIGRVQRHLTATMYEWEPNHISDAIEEAMRPRGNTLLMVTQKRGVGEGDATESAVEDMKRRIRTKFKHVWASVRGPRRLIQNSYHIKVASRDNEEFWLSSGNWKDSNQADIDPAGTNSTSDTPLREHNREWHAIIEHPGLATLFQKYIAYDFEQATLFPLEEGESVAPPDVQFFVPLEALEARRRARGQIKYADPLELDEELDVEPLLTPDRNAQGGPLFMTAATQMVKRATSRIYVQNQSFGFTGDDNEEITNFFTILKDQQDRGLDVRIIFRDASDFHRAADLEKQQQLIERLQHFGLDVSPNAMRVQPKCHTKGIIIDSKEVMLGSQNITNQGALFNRDASLLVRSPKVAKYFEKIFLFDWEHLAHNQVDERVGGIRRARPGEETPAGFRRISLSEILGDD